MTDYQLYTLIGSIFLAHSLSTERKGGSIILAIFALLIFFAKITI